MNILITVQNKIPSLFYGGTERVVWYLGLELHKLGHKVTFLAPEGSYCDFTNLLIFNPNKSLNDQIPENIDIVHIFDDNFIEKIDKPHIVTIEGNPFLINELNLNSVFVSKNHANRYNSESYVYNGLDWDAYKKPSFDNKREYFHFLGKAAWNVKNVKGAIEIIRASKKERIRILGGNRFHPNTFTFSNKVKFEGTVNDSEKSRLMNKSKGLLFPVLWHEPFGLAITESLFFGCPVFGTPYGSLQELVPKEVGFLSNSVNDLKEAVLNAENFDKKVCHEYALDNFNSRKMTLEYFNLYEKVLNGEKLNVKNPTEKTKNYTFEWNK
ncbi:glycosyltransferase [Flavobacterium sp. TP390]|uniref:Glycosyltransferase n=1 Tax=Flavobacterium profundi TaxID=1774945 RepID=A0A6I4IUQ7_9FLAO|nr:glycosyltransferase [Flavobacterium profundi]MVO10614.1 glycosyltransferase [Flavobacterium profundi]